MINIRQALKATALEKMVPSEPGCGSQRFHPTANFIGFSGHFPDFPILPAMLQVLLGIIVCEELYGSRLILQKLEKAKFMAQIKPEQILTVSCRLSHDPDKKSQPVAKARITITVADQKAASMTLFLQQT
jgi:3-hydroxyacyl-[acyl-carrier-protein] dehydratase